MISSLLSCQSPYRLFWYRYIAFMIPPSHIAGLSCNQNKKPNIWRIMCRRWLISDKEVGSELINKPLSPSYCYCKNVLVFFWQININFLQHMKVILIIIQFFWHSKGRVNWTSDLNMVKISGTSSIYFDPRKFWPVNDNQIYVLVKLYSTEGWSVEQVLASAPQNPLNLQYNFCKHWQAPALLNKPLVYHYGTLIWQ